MKRRLPVSEVYLFGSFARGDIHEGSDIDLIIVGDFNERLFKRIERVLELTDLPIEPLVYTREEIDEMIKEGNPLILHALKEGKEL
ncbi:MAG: nucleotidyltransferase domain-containing protein [Candidatus Bipolaricaulota bacterium]|nr:nucleotidyltransferase domain-containing protein [Candidatus Bipolaricaulota bacterium]